jgi:hypothetical protein
MTAKLAQAIREMSPEALRELEDFAEFLSKQKPRQHTTDRRLSLNWAGGLSDLKDQYASGVELAHAIRDEWADSAGKPRERKE